MNQYACKTPCPLRETRLRSKEFYEQVAENEFSFSYDDAAMKFSLKYNLFERMFKNSELFRDNQVLSTFYQDNLNAAIGKLVRIKELIVSLNDEALSSAEKEEIIEEAEGLNSSITPLTDPEENQQDVYEVYLSTIARNIHTFTSGQAESISSIAEQCPFHGGAAVYQARGIHRLINIAASFNDYETCQESPRETNSKDSPIYFLKVKPNPTDGEISFEFNCSDNTEWNIAILDAYGRALISEKKSCSGLTNASLNLEHLPAGLYWVQIGRAHGTFLTNKIVLQKP